MKETAIRQFDARQFSSDKILKHLDRVNQWLQGSNPSPITVELDMTNVCNHKCAECVVDYFRVNDNSFLSLVIAKKIIAQLSKNKIRGVIFTGGGEPLCNPYTIEAVKFARIKGLELGFITNGSLINDKSAEVILNNCSWVRVSLDAASPEVYGLTHGMDGNEFNEVVDKIKILVEAQKRLKSKCVIGVGFLTCEQTISDMVKAAALTKN